MKHHCFSLTVILSNVLGQSKTEEEVNSFVKRYFMASSFPHLSSDQEGKVCGLVLTEQRPIGRIQVVLCISNQKSKAMVASPEIPN